MNPLTVDSTKEILRLHQKINTEILGALAQTFQKNLVNVIRIGELLTEQKEFLDHGQFLPWLETLPFTERAAQRYMRLYAKKGDPRLTTATSLTEAYKLLGPKKRPTPKPELPKTPEDPSNTTRVSYLGSKLSKYNDSSDVKSDTAVSDLSSEGNDLDPVDSIDVSDGIFDESVDEDNCPTYEGETATEVIEATGLRPVNWAPAPEPPTDPLLAKREALPDEWIEPLHVMLEAGYRDAVSRFLKKMLERYNLDPHIR